MALAFQHCGEEAQLHELIIDGIYDKKAPGVSSSNQSEADIAVNEFLSLTRARYGFGPVADLFKAYLSTGPGN